MASDPSDTAGAARRLGRQVLAEPGQVGRYSPIALLGRGGVADVFLALLEGPRDVNRLVVLKQLRDPVDHDLLEMFVDEARLGVRLCHPNIAQIYDIDGVCSEHRIVMEYLEGQPLSDVQRAVSAENNWPRDALVAFMMSEVLKGLHYAHECKGLDEQPLRIVHRDISPHNIFVTYGGEVKVLDFGIAKATVNRTRTASGAIKGKFRYMSPEQVGSEDVDRRVDIFSAGIVLWEMLAHRPLFVGTPHAIMMRILSQDVPQLRTVRPDVPASLDAIVRRALQRERADRYETAEEMRLALEAFLHSQGETGLGNELGSLVARQFASARDKVRARITEFAAGRRALPEEGVPASHPSSSVAVTVESPPTDDVAVDRNPFRDGRSRAVASMALAVIGLVALPLAGREWGVHERAASSAVADQPTEMRSATDKDPRNRGPRADSSLGSDDRPLSIAQATRPQPEHRPNETEGRELQGDGCRAPRIANGDDAAVADGATGAHGSQRGMVDPRRGPRIPPRANGAIRPQSANACAVPGHDSKQCAAVAGVPLALPRWNIKMLGDE